MIDFSKVKSVIIPEGDVKKIEIDGVTVWEKSTSRLPDEYQEVEYIESTGTQYINTGVIGKSGIRILATMGWRTLSNTLFGSRKDGNATRFFVTYYNSRIDFGYTGDIVSGIYPQAGQLYEIDFDTRNSTKRFGVDGIYITNIANIDTKCNIYIFCYNRNGTIMSQSKSIFKSMTITNTNNEILRDFIPCYRKSDGEIGMYDTVSRTFYTNAGTGTFLKGTDV